jgi:hypothetical protein
MNSLKKDNKNNIRLSLVVAINNSNLGIGYKSQLPWRIPKGYTYIFIFNKK